LLLAKIGSLLGQMVVLVVVLASPEVVEVEVAEGGFLELKQHPHLQSCVSS
jgi:hypothetical protein